MALGAIAPAQATDQAVVVVSTDGSQRQVLISDLARIDIGSDGLTLVTTGGESITTAYADIDRVLIGAEYTAVADLLGDNEVAMWPTITSDVVNIAGLPEGTAVSVAGLNGTTVLRTASSN